MLTTPDEVLALPITYNNAKCVEQKDNTLFFANLTETKTRYKDELQNIANNITIKYNINSESENYYAQPLNAADRKTYRRGEVYSFGIGVIFKDGTPSYTYHIPAPSAAGT